MTSKFILSQVAAFIAWLFFILSYHAKRENKIILLQVFSGIFYSISYFLAGATMGLFISCFETVNEFIYYKTDKDKYIFIFTIPVYIVIGLLSREVYYLAIIPIIASIIDGYGLIRNNKVMVGCGTISNLLWIFYDLYYLEYITALGDLIIVISNLSIIIYGIHKYLNRRKIRIYYLKELNNKDLEDIKKLDDICYDSIYRWPQEKLNELYEKNKDSYLLVKYKGETVGYVNFLNVREDIYNKALENDHILDSFDSSDILPYRKTNHLFINLNSIVLKREYNHRKIIRKMESSINKYIKNKINNNYKIKKIYIYVVNELEEKVVKNLGFKRIKNITKECILYSKAY